MPCSSHAGPQAVLEPAGFGAGALHTPSEHTHARLLLSLCCVAGVAAAGQVLPVHARPGRGAGGEDVHHAAGRRKVRLFGGELGSGALRTTQAGMRVGSWLLPTGSSGTAPSPPSVTPRSPWAGIIKVKAPPILKGCGALPCCRAPHMTTRPENIEAIEPPAAAIMVGLLEELEDVPVPICTALLQALAAPDDNHAAQR